jgi:hypothetical protein
MGSIAYNTTVPLPKESTVDAPLTDAKEQKQCDTTCIAILSTLGVITVAAPMCVLAIGLWKLFKDPVNHIGYEQLP